MHCHLQVDDIAQQSIAITQNRCGCFVAGAFNTKDEHARFFPGWGFRGWFEK